MPGQPGGPGGVFPQSEDRQNSFLGVPGPGDFLFEMVFFGFQFPEYLPVLCGIPDAPA